MSLSLEKTVEIISLMLDHLRAERDEARTELAEVRKELATLQERSDGWQGDANRYAAERDEARKESAELRAVNDTPALAGDALRDALKQAIDDIRNASPRSSFDAETDEIVEAIMPIVGRAALAARSAFPAPPFTMDHTFGYTPAERPVYRMAEPCRCCAVEVSLEWGNPAHVKCTTCSHYAIEHTGAPEPERELRIQRHTSAKGTVSWRGQCSRCAWSRYLDDPDEVEGAYARHACIDYTENEGQ